MWEGVGDRTELQYIDPYSYGRQRCVFLVLQGCSTGGPGAQLSAECWLSLPHLVTNGSPKLLGTPRAPSAWRGLPYHISSLTPTLWHLVLTELYNSSRPLNPWNGIFDRHQAEITVMQFTGNSLPVHQSVAAQWDLHLVPYYQPNSPAQFLSINGHWDVSLSLSLEWHVCSGRRSKYNSRAIWIASKLIL